MFGPKKTGFKISDAYVRDDGYFVIHIRDYELPIWTRAYTVTFNVQPTLEMIKIEALATRERIQNRIENDSKICKEFKGVRVQ